MQLLRRSLVVLITSVSLAACSGGTSGSGSARDDLSPQAALVQAAQASQDVPSSRFELTSTSEVGGQKIDVRGSGLFDPASKSGEFSFTFPGLGGDLKQRIIGDELFLQLPNEPEVFYRLDVSELADTTLLDSTEPTAGAQVLAGANADVVEVGREDVRGEPTTHYRGTFDVRKALEAAQGPAKDILERTLGATELSEVPFDAYLDDEGRVRRIDQTLKIKNPMTQGQEVSVQTRVEIFDFGVEVDVQAPPAEQVKDGQPLLDAFRGATGG